MSKQFATGGLAGDIRAIDMLLRTCEEPSIRAALEMRRSRLEQALERAMN